MANKRVRHIACKQGRRLAYIIHPQGVIQLVEQVGIVDEWDYISGGTRRKDGSEVWDYISGWGRMRESVFSGGICVVPMI